MKKIGLIMSTLDTSTTFEMYQGIVDASNAAGYSTLAFHIFPTSGVSHYYYKGEFHIMEIMDFNHYDGLIVSINTISSVPLRQSIIEYLEHSDKPIVAIDCNIKGAYCISTSNYNASKNLTEHLIRVHGRKKINYITGPMGNDESIAREKAYTDVMKKNGLFDENRIYPGSFFVSDGENALSFFEQSETAKDYDAIICANDMSALAIIEALEKRGKKVPEDVAVIGYDDIEEASFCNTPLSTVLKNSYEVGKKAVSLLKKFWNEQSVPRFTPIESRLIFRESCGCKSDPEQILNKVRKRNLFFTENNLAMVHVRRCIEDCMDSNNFAEYVLALQTFIREIDPKSFYLCIYEKHCRELELENYHCFRTPLKEGNGQLIIPFYYVDGTFYNDPKYVDDTVFTAHNTLLDKNQYVISPIHFREINYGFLLLGGSDYPFMEAYRSWMEGLNSTINSLHDRLLLQSAVNQLNDLYMRDSLTGLYNRFGLSYFWNKMEEQCRERSQTLLIVFIDVNGLKKINDTYGHDDGDFTISTVANAMKAINNQNIISIRFGGDEFLLLGPNMNETDGLQIRDTFDNNIKQLNIVSNKPYIISASCGFFVKTPDMEISLNSCIKMADENMYETKKKYYDSMGVVK